MSFQLLKYFSLETNNKMLEKNISLWKKTFSHFYNKIFIIKQYLKGLQR